MNYSFGASARLNNVFLRTSPANIRSNTALGQELFFVQQCVARYLTWKFLTDRVEFQ